MYESSEHDIAMLYFSFYYKSKKSLGLSATQKLQKIIKVKNIDVIAMAWCMPHEFKAQKSVIEVVCMRHSQIIHELLCVWCSCRSRLVGKVYNLANQTISMIIRRKQNLRIEIHSSTKI